MSSGAQCVVRECVVTRSREGVMRRQGAMHRQGVCRQNASAAGDALSEGNASSGNVSSQCVVRGWGRRQCGVSMCRQRQRERSYPSGGCPAQTNLHTMTFTHRSFLQTNTFSQMHFYTQTLLQTNIFTRKHQYTHKHFYKEGFTLKQFCTNAPAKLRFYVPRGNLCARNESRSSKTE